MRRLKTKRLDKIALPVEYGNWRFRGYEPGEDLNETEKEERKVEKDIVNVGNRFIGHDPQIIPITIDKLYNKNLAGYSFNILLFEVEEYNLDEASYKEYIKEKLNEYEVPTDGRITFAANSTSGDPITPWMVCHKIGHALLDDLYDIKAQLEVAERKLLGNDNFGLFDIIKCFDFHSARNFSQMADATDTEFIYDLVASYLISDGIKVNYQGKCEGIAPYVQYIENIIEKRLNNSIGYIITDFFV